MPVPAHGGRAELDPELAELAANGGIEWLAGEFAPQQLAASGWWWPPPIGAKVNALVCWKRESGADLCQRGG